MTIASVKKPTPRKGKQQKTVTVTDMLTMDEMQKIMDDEYSQIPWEGGLPPIEDTAWFGLEEGEESPQGIRKPKPK